MAGFFYSFLPEAGLAAERVFADNHKMELYGHCRNCAVNERNEEN
jgi:Fe2+ or Zn2+ uptake regulation protein